MRADRLEIVALTIAEMNLAFIPNSEAFQFRNPGKLREPNRNLRKFTTWSGGLKSLTSELSKYTDDSGLFSILAKYGCNSIEREFICLDFLTQALGRTIEKNATLYDVVREEN